MRRPVPALLLAIAACARTPVAAPAPTATDDPNLARAHRVLAASPLIDGHNDLPWAIREWKEHPHDVEQYDLRRPVPGHTDLARLAAGRVGGQFWSVYIPGDTSVARQGYAKVQLEQIDIAKRVMAKYPERFEPVTTAQGFTDAFARGHIGGALGLEGGHAIENSLGALRAFYDMGGRYMTLTHNSTLDWADAASDVVRHGGLSSFGREVVREMNRLGMLVDLSHVSPGTMSDALDVTEAPVIFSHSNARGLADHVRNVPDSILVRLKQNGGVVMVTFVPGFTSQALIDWNRTAPAQRTGPAPKVTLAQVADHIEHIRRVAGIDHVGLGGDFDGITEVVDGLEDVSRYPMLIAELARRGWTDEELAKLAGGNVLRAFAQAERVAARLRASRPPSTATIEQLDRRP
ncbi:MAG: dipeptidase [Gemmatimonadetes bacterium]|nr:dipeptidase [Gemmatimonadota bacterium]